MKDEDKTRERLIQEVKELRRRLAEAAVNPDSGPEMFEKKEEVKHHRRGVMSDVASHERAEEKLRDQLLFFQTLIDTIPGPIFYKDVKGRYLGCNKAFERFLGLSGEQIIGRTVYDVAPKDLADRYREQDEALFRYPGTQVYESSVLYADGTRHDVIFHKAVFNNLQGAPAGLVGVMLDITERRRAEKALQKTHQDLERMVEDRTARLAAAIEDLRNEVDQRIKAEQALTEAGEKFKMFAYSIVHDLKSPLTGIYGLAGKLLMQYREVLDDRGQQYCRHILKASEHVADLVEKINIYIAAKESPLKFENVKIQEILQIVREEFSNQLSLRRIRWVATEEDVVIMADRASLLRVFRNLVDNALKYGGEQLSELKIVYENKEKHLTFRVTDNGVGLPSKDSKKIFKMFERRTAAREVPGAGLGLATVLEIAERHGGRTWCEVGEVKGATFCFAIPWHM